jgi:hypothetical protein
MEMSDNGGDQRLATKGLSTPPDSIASPLHRLVRRDRAGLLSKQLLILVMVTDPVPEKSVVFENRQRSIACANANRPDSPALLKPQGRMPGVSLPKPICSTRPAFDIRRKPAVRRPEVTRCR